MLSGFEENKQNDTVKMILDRLTNLEFNKSHDWHIHHQECQHIGLKIERLEDKKSQKFQDLVLTVHHCFMHTLANTNAFKIIEDYRGRALVKIQTL